MSQPGPWDEDAMWVPDAEPSDGEVELSELAQAIMENYMPVTSLGTDYIHHAILEFEDYRRKGIPYTYNDEVVTIEEFLATIDNILRCRVASGESA
jgi:hypothetical protein